jgi:hypothetical protein
VPVPDPIRDRVARGAPKLNLAKITGGMQPSEIRFEVDRGARFVVYQYAVSVLIMSFRRNSDVQFVRANQSRAVKSLPWTGLSLFLGWWGIPWGFIYTPQVLYRNLKGGTDVTPAVIATLN